MEEEIKKEQPSTVAKLKDNLPMLSIGLIIIGISNLIVYYRHFNIDIITYLDFTEVLQMQFTSFVMSFAIVLFLYLSVGFFSVIGPSYEQIVEYRIEFQASHSPEQIKLIQEKNRKESRKSKFILFLLLSILLLPYIAKLIVDYDSTDGIILGCISILVVATIIDTIYTFFLQAEEDKTYFNNKPKFVLARQIGLFVFLLYTNIIAAHITAVAYQFPSSINEVTITTEKSTITTGKDLRYIGKTKNFTFFYNIVKKKASIYPNGDIKATDISAGTDYRTAEEKEIKPLQYYIDKAKALINKKSKH